MEEIGDVKVARLERDMTTQIMAIINTSPDSFSGDGLYAENQTALRQKVTQALTDGADILDIGGQSTRPGAETISDTEEIARVVPAIQVARSVSADVPISIDTCKPTVARAAFAAGATILNDVTGLSDPAMVDFAAAQQCEVVVMHMRGTPQTMSQLTEYQGGVVHDVAAFFKVRTAELISKGIAPERIIIDPGIGFAKTAAQSFELTRDLEVLGQLGFRVLYGASNKSFIGKVIGSEESPAPIEERAAGTVAVQAYAMLHGAAIVRVHDVKAAVQTRAVMAALCGSEA